MKKLNISPMIRSATGAVDPDTCKMIGHYKQNNEREITLIMRQMNRYFDVQKC